MKSLGHWIIYGAGVFQGEELNGGKYYAGSLPTEQTVGTYHILHSSCRRFGDHHPLFYRPLSSSKLVVEEIARSIVPPG